MRFRPLAPAPLLAAAACAPRPAPLDAPATPTTINTSAWGLDIVLEDERAGPGTTVPEEADVVWAALADVYQELGIPLGVLDRARGAIGDADFRTRRRLGGETMSRYISCGSNLTSPLANNYRVTLSVMSTVQPRGPRETDVTTEVDATALSNQGSSGHACSAPARGSWRGGASRWSASASLAGREPGRCARPRGRRIPPPAG